MQTSFLQLAAFAFTCLVFGGLGYLASKRLKQPIAIFTWVLIVAATLVLGSFFAATAKLVSIFGFDVYVNWSVRVFGVGLIIGLLIHLARSRQVRKSET